MQVDPSRKEMQIAHPDTLGMFHRCFGTFAEFENTVTALTHRIHGITKEVSTKDLISDYEDMEKKLGREPHFEEIRAMSRLGIEYYLRMYGSLSRFRQIRSMRRNKG